MLSLVISESLGKFCDLLSPVSQKEPDEMLVQDCLHHGTLAVIPSGSSAKNLRLPLESRSSFSAEVDVETTFLI